MRKCCSTADPHTLFDSNVWMLSCEVVALRENFVNRPESCGSLSTKICIPGDISCARKNTHGLGYIFLHPHTQPAPNQGSKIFLRHFPTTLVPSLTLQISDFVQSSLENLTFDFLLIICHIRDLHVWPRVKGKSNFERLVMVRE
jgi:hypothetical protein